MCFDCVHRKKKTIKSKKPLTFRIKKIHIDKFKNDFQCEFIFMIECDLVLKQNAIIVQTHAIVSKNQKKACAIVTFYTSISKNEMMKRLCKTSASTQYRFDDNYESITSLYDVSDNANVE